MSRWKRDTKTTGDVLRIGALLMHLDIEIVWHGWIQPDGTNIELLELKKGYFHYLTKHN